VALAPILHCFALLRWAFVLLEIPGSHSAMGEGLFGMWIMVHISIQWVDYRFTSFA
jgi:hypothetical protein